MIWIVLPSLQATWLVERLGFVEKKAQTPCRLQGCHQSHAGAVQRATSHQDAGVQTTFRKEIRAEKGRQTARIERTLCCGRSQRRSSTRQRFSWMRQLKASNEIDGTNVKFVNHRGRFDIFL